MNAYFKCGIVLLFFLQTNLQASAFAIMPAITYHGRLLNAKGQPVLTNTQFRVQITSPGAEACVLYEEIISQDLSLSDGAFSLVLNDGMGTRTDTTGLSIAN